MSYVYFAEPIDFSGGRSELSVHGYAALVGRNLSVFSPRLAWKAFRQTNGLQEVNEGALSKAAAMVAVIDGTFSVGVPSELQYAKDRGVPTFVLTTEQLLSTSQSIQRLATGGVFTQPEALAEAVEQYASLTGETRIGRILRDPDVRQFSLPRQAKDGDVGLDLFVADEVTIPPGEWRGVPSRVKVAPPPDVWFLIMGRSSTLHARGLITVASVIDSGFRGDLFALCHNISESPVTVKPGERVAQLVPLPRIPFQFVEVAELAMSERGESGFGSTGA